MKFFTGLVVALTLTSTSVLAHPALNAHAHPHDAALGLDMMLAVTAVLATGLVALMAARHGR